MLEPVRALTIFIVVGGSVGNPRCIPLPNLGSLIQTILYTTAFMCTVHGMYTGQQNAIFPVALTQLLTVFHDESKVVNTRKNPGYNE